MPNSRKSMPQNWHFLDYYQSGKADTDAFATLSNRLSTGQNGYEDESAGLLANRFITANRPYIPSEYESNETYWQHN